MTIMRYFIFVIIVTGWLPVAKATICATQTDIPESECNALVDIFNNTTGAGWYDIFEAGWNMTDTPCSWVGVVCSNGHVIQVDRTNQGLKGTVPNLTNLTQLEVLNLADNQITGTIEAATLPPSLQALSLSNNPLTGTPDLSTLPNLTTVDLDFPLTVNKSAQGTITSSSAGISCGTDCTFSYDYGTSVTLTASPAAGYTIAWSGACIGATRSCQVTMNKAQHVTATFESIPPPTTSNTLTVTTEGNGTVTSSLAGINCGTDCTEEYVENTAITLTANPKADSVFVKWTGGGCTGTTPSCQVTMTQNQQVTARFELIPPKQLAVQTQGDGTVTSVPIGIDCGTDCEESYRFNTLVTLTAQPDTHSLFTGWEGAFCQGTALDCQVAMNQAQNVTAIFTTIETYRLSVSRNGLGTGSVTGNSINCGEDCSADYNANTIVTLTAAPAADSRFSGWSDACSGTTASCQVTLTQAQNVTATFDLIPPKLLTVQTQGDGTVSSFPTGIDCGADCEGAYRLNTSVILTARPKTHYFFTGWSGACSGTTADCQVAMTQAQNVTATFAIKTYHLNVSKKGLGSGNITGNSIECGNTNTCSADYNANTLVTLTAKPTNNSLFVGWSGDCAGTAACEVTMITAQNVTATFNPLPPNTFALTVNQTGTGNGRVTGTGINCGSDCSEQYVENTLVTLTATPSLADSTFSADSMFAGWSGACSGTTPSCQVTLTQAQNVTAIFNLIPKPEYVLTVSTQGPGLGQITGQGIDCKEDCTETYLENTSVILTAKPEAGSILASWQSDGCTGTGTCTVLMSANQHVTATFEPVPADKFALTVNQIGTGNGSITGNGIDCGNDCTEQYTKGTAITLTATSLADSLFIGWSGACVGMADCQVILNAAQNVTATFNRLEYELSVSKQGTGSGQVTGQGIHCGKDCVESYLKGALISLTAAPVAGSRFVGWQGACTGTEECTVTMEAAQNVKATFNLIPPPEYQLTVNQTGTGSGQFMVNGIDCGTQCVQQSVENTSVILTATPSADSTFAGWNGAGCSGTGTCSVTMTAVQTVTATFELVPPDSYSLTVNRLGNGRVTGEGIDCGDNCTETYLENTSVTLSAAPVDNATFVGWDGACSGTTPTCEVTMTQARNVTAQFESPVNKITLSQLPTRQQVSVGETFDIVFQIQADAQKVDLVVLEWQVEAELLQVIELIKGNALDQDITPSQSDCNKEKGCIALRVKSASPVSGTFEVAKITLLAKQAGNTELYFTETTDVRFANQSVLNKPIEKTPIVIIGTPSLTVNQVGTGEGTITGPGIECPTDCTEQFQMNKIVPLVATAYNNSTFAGWNGVCAGTTPSCQVTMTQAQNVTATFNLIPKPEYVLTVNTQGTGLGQITGQGIDCQADCTETYPENTPVILTVKPETGSIFAGWQGGGCTGTGTCTVMMTANQTVTATFNYVPPEPVALLTINKTGTGNVIGNGIECGQECSELYALGTRITLTATADEGFIFAGWEGDCSGKNDCQLTMTTDKTVIATFKEDGNPEVLCPTTGLITSVCNAQGQTLTDVTLAQGASVSNAVLEGTIHNDGWISNSTIQADAELIGGIVTGTIINNGTLRDFEFRGASVTGGTLAGTINNTSQAGGLFQEVSLAPNTRISGGGLQGIIAGDVNAPAWLDKIEIRENSQLSGVQLSDTVQLGNNVDVTELLPDLPPPPDCDIALLTQMTRMDLSNAVFESGDGLLNAINELPYFKDNHWVVTQNAHDGYLQLTIEVLRVAVQPQSVTSTNRSAALDLLAQQQVRFITDNGMAILAQPAVQAPCALQTGLAQLGLPDAIPQQNGNLRIFATDEYGYSARPDWIALERDEMDEVTPGLFLGESPFISGIVLAYVVFVDENGIARQQFFYPAPVLPEDLYSAAENLVVTDEGLVSFSLDGQHYYGVLDYLVIKDTPPTQNHLQIESIRDINGDAKEDWVLIYPSGERQILFQWLP